MLELSKQREANCLKGHQKITLQTPSRRGSLLKETFFQERQGSQLKISHMLDDDRTSVTTQSKWSITLVDKEDHPTSHKGTRGPLRVFEPQKSPNTNHSMMEKSHLSENYFSLARKHE